MGMRCSKIMVRRAPFAGIICPPLLFMEPIEDINNYGVQGCTHSSSNTVEMTINAIKIEENHTDDDDDNDDDDYDGQLSLSSFWG